MVGLGNTSIVDRTASSSRCELCRELVFGEDETTYVAPFPGDSEFTPDDLSAQIVAIGQDGRVKPGWPYRLAAGRGVWALFAAPGGGVYATTYVWGARQAWELVRLTNAGQLVGW